MGTTNSSDFNAYLLITEPGTDYTQISRSEFVKLEYLNYKCERKRNELGIPYGTTERAILDFAAICSSDKLDKLYDELSNTLSCTIAVFFNPEFIPKSDKEGKITNFNRGFEATGYVVSMNEIAGYQENILNKRTLENIGDKIKEKLGKNDQKNVFADSVTMQVKFLLNSIKYIYSKSNITETNSILYINY